MTRAEFENMSFEDLMEYAKENLNDVTDEETLKRFAIEKLENDDFNMALHIINAMCSTSFTCSAVNVLGFMILSKRSSVS